MDSADVAGVVPVGNWNNAPSGSSDTNVSLVDDSGAASSTTMDFSAPGAWSVGTDGAGSPADKKMMTGYLDMSGNGSGQTIDVSFADIPYALYDVYVYHSSSGGPNRSMSVTLNGSTTVYTRNLSPANTFDGFLLDQHDTLDASNASADGGNYVMFSRVSGDVLSIVAQGIGASDGGYPGSGDTRRGPIQGIQIHEVPEPSALLLAAAGILGLVCIGRRMKRAK
jgi:hypothetical protein